MLTELEVARHDGRLLSPMSAWVRIGVLVIDDFGLQPFTTQQAGDLLEVIEEVTVEDDGTAQVVRPRLLSESGPKP